MTVLIEQLSASRQHLSLVAGLSDEVRNQVLTDLAQLLTEHAPAILAANAIDLAQMNITDPRYDRLLLNPSRLHSMQRELLTVAKLPSPLNQLLEQRILPNGLELKKVKVPLGAIAVIYEARPNVTIDVFSLCFKAGNIALLKGGKEAWHTNCALTKLIHQALHHNHLPAELMLLLPPDRESVKELLSATRLVDVCIPRGSQQLIEFVRTHAKIPIIETGAGIVHTYVDASGDIGMAREIIHNAKTRRVSVCNALDSLLIHASRLAELPQLVAPLATANVTIYADASTQAALAGHYPPSLLMPATSQSYGCEFLDYKLAIKAVPSLHAAIEHITQYSSGHSEAIISNDPGAVAEFMQRIDAAVIYANASTAFTDGGQFGMGAEIGISTQKLHARGPMALNELTSYKWLVFGNGQTRC